MPLLGTRHGKKTSIYFIMKKAKADKTIDNLRHQNLKKTKRNVNVAAVATILKKIAT
jgi:hypothetical protein